MFGVGCWRSARDSQRKEEKNANNNVNFRILFLFAIGGLRQYTMNHMFNESY